MTRSRANAIKDFYEGDYNLGQLELSTHVYWEKAYSAFKRLNLGKKPLKLLDVGCEDGVLSVRLKGLGYDVYGLELRNEQVMKSRKRGIRAVQGSAEHRFPFRDSFFDAVFAGDVIEHLYDTDFLIEEAWRVLKPGGFFVVTTPNLASLSNRIRLLFGKIPVGSEIRLGKGSAGHIRNYTFPALEQQLKEHNFSVIKKLSSNIIFPVKYRVPFLRSLAIKLGDYTPNIGSHIIMVCRKFI